LDERRICVVASPEQILLLDACCGQEIWSHRIAFSVSKAGILPEIVGHQNILLVMAYCNFGSVLECLDGATGRSRWPDLRYLGAGSIRLRTGAVDDANLYLVRDQEMAAYSLRDGSPVWRRDLPAVNRSWRLIRARDYLIVFPQPEPRLELRIDWFNWSTKAMVRVDLLSPWAVRLCDVKSGQIVQCLNFAATPGGPELVLERRSTGTSNSLFSVHLHEDTNSLLPVLASTRGLLVTRGNQTLALQP
jgi:hypothetical protein